MSKPDQLSAYLSELADALDVLGPDEVNETIREIFSDVKEAASENEVELLGALERLGPPRILAERILEERGVLSVDSPVHGATCLDVLCGLCDRCCGVVGHPGLSWAPRPVGYLFFVEQTWRNGGKVVFVAALGVLAAAWTWFYFVLPLRSGRSTRVGFGVMGLRRVRVGFYVKDRQDLRDSGLIEQGLTVRAFAMDCGRDGSPCIRRPGGFGISGRSRQRIVFSRSRFR